MDGAIFMVCDYTWRPFGPIAGVCIHFVYRQDGFYPGFLTFMLVGVGRMDGLHGGTLQCKLGYDWGSSHVDLHGRRFHRCLGTENKKSS